jgi:hypothetical protein
MYVLRGLHERDGACVSQLRRRAGEPPATYNSGFDRGRAQLKKMADKTFQRRCLKRERSF